MRYCSRRRITAAIALCAAMSWGAVDASAPAEAGSASTSRSVLNDVAVVTADDAWAVGHTEDGTSVDTFVEHWDGSAWSPVSAPSPSDTAILESVSATGADDVWAVGTYYVKRRAYPMAIHWDGTSWTDSALPQFASPTYLYGVSAVSPTQAWATGYASTGGSKALILRWDGSTWQKSSELPGSFGVSRNFAIDAVSPNSAITVGYRYKSVDLATPIAQRWDGKTWTLDRLPHPRKSTFTQLESVTALSSDEAWAVGWTTDGMSGVPVIDRWDGSSWARVAAPNPRNHESDFHAVSATSSEDAWAVGETGVSARPLLAHWNGATWSRIPAPPLGDGPAGLNGIAEASASDAWAVGFNNGTALVLHWDGEHWAQVM